MMSREEKKKRDILSEFGEDEGRKIIAEAEQIEEHCRVNNITRHSINADGSCNIGCC